MARIRVDDVPIPLRPLFHLYGYGLGLLLYALTFLQRFTVRVRVAGAERLSPGARYIFCAWHESSLLCFQSQMPPRAAIWRGRSQVMMQHPIWYMRPIHVYLWLAGIRRLALGSTGHDGRRAADELVGLLRQGHSTLLLPDGPAGPPKRLRRGVLHIAQASQTPIVPLRLAAKPSAALPSWDRKRIALPFAQLRLEVGAPIDVPSTGLAEAERLLVRALG
jgi:lysophospholipid acyltransferase (LPLAT)-like uncharacterized protein